MNFLNSFCVSLWCEPHSCLYQLSISLLHLLIHNTHSYKFPYLTHMFSKHQWFTPLLFIPIKMELNSSMKLESIRDHSVLESYCTEVNYRFTLVRIKTWKEPILVRKIYINLQKCHKKVSLAHLNFELSRNLPDVRTSCMLI